jgi:putative transcriptional regulator
MDVKAIRKATSLTQAAFADAYRLPLRTLQDWEQERFKPEGATVTLLAMIAADPVAVRELISRANI